MLPKFSIQLPVYNAEHYLAKCLDSIERQDYPRDKVEVLIADGGSTDRTQEIAQRYDTILLDNPKRLADYGSKIIAAHATGDLLVCLAADNELHSRNWLMNVATLFQRYVDLAAVWGSIVSGRDDPAINKYYALIQSDPFFFFMNQNLNWYLKRAHVEEIMGKKCYFFDVQKERPLIWGANGLTYRFSLVRDIILREQFVADNDVFQIMLEMGHNKVAYMPSLETVHHTVDSLKEWASKWKRNFSKHLLGQQEMRNLNWVFVKHFKLKLILWLIYSLVPIFSTADAIYRAIKDRNLCWLYHPVAAFAQSAVYICLTLGTRAGRRMVLDVFGVGKPSSETA